MPLFGRLTLFVMSLCLSVSLLTSACAHDENKNVVVGFLGWRVYIGEKYGEILDLILASQQKQGEERRGFKVESSTQGQGQDAGTTTVVLNAEQDTSLHERYVQKRRGKWTIKWGANNKAEGSFLPVRRGTFWRPHY